MIVLVDPATRAVSVDERDDFASLKVVVEGPEEGALELLGASAEPDGHAWLPARSIEEWAAPTSEEWTAAYRAMLAKVEHYGWYRQSSDEVKVHIELRTD